MSGLVKYRRLLSVSGVHNDGAAFVFQAAREPGTRLFIIHGQDTQAATYKLRFPSKSTLEAHALQLGKM